jgi:hypothetical protein
MDSGFSRAEKSAGDLEEALDLPGGVGGVEDVVQLRLAVEGVDPVGAVGGERG